jgi:hypothetical protein
MKHQAIRHVPVSLTKKEKQVDYCMGILFSLNMNTLAMETASTCFSIAPRKHKESA